METENKKEICEMEAEKKNENGATMVEYALLVALMSIASIAVIVVMSQGTSNKFSQVTSALQ